MENKMYYTPTIEDLRVGFEFEFKNDPPPEDDWKGDIVECFDNLQWLDGWINDGRIRVPYLTKEQIEKEGWTVVASRRRWHVHVVTKKYHGVYDLHTKWLSVWETERGLPLYRGTCRCINDFRLIMKLIGT